MYLVYLPDVGRPSEPLIRKHVGRGSSSVSDNQEEDQSRNPRRRRAYHGIASTEDLEVRHDRRVAWQPPVAGLRLMYHEVVNSGEALRRVIIDHEGTSTRAPYSRESAQTSSVEMRGLASCKTLARGRCCRKNAVKRSHCCHAALEIITCTININH